MLSVPPDNPYGGEDGSSEAGFTLIEALVTLAILALVLSTLMGVMTDAFGRAARADAVTRASLHARSLLDKVAADIPLETGTRMGELPDGMHWQLRIEPFGDAADQRAWPVTPYTISAEVSWHERQQPRSVVISTLRLGSKAK